jgi:hypothetical protein
LPGHADTLLIVDLELIQGGFHAGSTSLFSRNDHADRLVSSHGDSPKFTDLARLEGRREGDSNMDLRIHERILRDMGSSTGDY